MSADQPDPRVRAQALIERFFAVLDDGLLLMRELAQETNGHEAQDVDAERLVYFAMLRAVVDGLGRTAEDVVTVLRQAPQPLGPISAEWLRRQERGFQDE